MVSEQEDPRASKSREPRVSVSSLQASSMRDASLQNPLLSLMRSQVHGLTARFSYSLSPRAFNDIMASSMVKPGALSPLYSHLKEFPLIGSTSIPTPKLRDSQLYLLNITLKRSRDSSVLPVIRAQSSPDYFPDSKFYKVEAILRPWRVPQVSSALLKMGIRGVTVSDVRGFGAQGGLTERQAGSEFSEDKFLAKVKMEIVVSKDQVEAVIDKIIEEARTGEIGDGKIFLVPVSDVIRVRTGERGDKADRMVGGRGDMSSAFQN